MTVGESHEGYKLVENKITTTSRWSVHYSLVLEKDGRFYQKSYSIGATEAQSEEPFEYDPEEISFKEVFPVKIETTEYK